MTRITIEIEGDAAPLSTGEAPQAAVSAVAPPPEVAAAAAAVGASNGGPAPAIAELSGVPSLPQASGVSDEPAAPVSDMSAGAAPDAPLEPPPVEVGAEGDAAAEEEAT
jgi:hypothetical protein